MRWSSASASPQKSCQVRNSGNIISGVFTPVRGENQNRLTSLGVQLRATELKTDQRFAPRIGELLPINALGSWKAGWRIPAFTASTTDLVPLERLLEAPMSVGTGSADGAAPWIGAGEPRARMDREAELLPVNQTRTPQPRE
jgi:hypothetical protein